MSNIKLKDNNWDTIGVYDSAIGKTQREINAKVIGNAVSRDVVIDDITFVRGSINQAGKTTSNNTNRARTSNYLSFYGATTVNVYLRDSLYEYSFRFYNIKTGEYLRSDSAWSTGDRSLTWNDDECIRVVVRLASDENITNVTLLQGIIGFEYTLGEIYTDPSPDGFKIGGNTEILAAKTISFEDGTQPINEYYLVASPITRIAYKTYDFNIYTPICVLPFAFLDYYSYGITSDDNIVAVFTIQALNDDNFVDKNNGTDACRKPFYIFFKSEQYQIAHKIDLTLTNKINPTGWFNNSGFYAYNGGFLFCEYTRTIVQTCNVWKVVGDISDPSNWVIKLQLTLSGINSGLKHMHCLVHDPVTNYLYMSSGDDNTGAKTYYSIDLGDTWTLLHESQEKYDRYVNLIFTKDYIYYATDAFDSGKHYLYRTIRKNGIMSFEDIEILQDLNSRPIASYGTIYLPSLNKLFLPERRDSANGNSINIITYDIETDTINILEALSSDEDERLGFRCKYIDYVSRNNIVRCGFGASFPLHNGGYANYFTIFNNAWPGVPLRQCNNLVLRFDDKNVSIETNMR